MLIEHQCGAIDAAILGHYSKLLNESTLQNNNVTANEAIHSNDMVSATLLASNVTDPGANATQSSNVREASRPASVDFLLLKPNFSVRVTFVLPQCLVGSEAEKRNLERWCWRCFHPHGVQITA
ncbi:unnamed protein product [Somion occarium]|uniref:Uncharacterized protein n=1 Tax=Somion occarium TaxID=3059160 RepID=A0ABP1DIK1_9APHY